MERVTSANAGGTDLLAAPFTIMDFELPSARKNADGIADELAGSAEYERHFDDAPWSIQVKIEPVTDTSVSALCSAFRAGNMLAWDGGTSTITSAEVTADEDHGTMRLLTFGGTRRPAWRDAPYPFTLTIPGGVGMAALPTVPGTIAASMDIIVTSATTATMSALGIKHAPLSGYYPFDSPGAWSANVPLSAVPATIWQDGPRDVASNRGLHYGIAHVQHNSTILGAVKWRLASTLLTASGQDRPVASGVKSVNGTVGAEETICIGKVSIPAAPTPAGQTANSSAYTANAVGINQTIHNATLPNGWNAWAMTCSRDRLHAITIRSAKDNFDGIIRVYRLNAAGTMLTECLLDRNFGDGTEHDWTFVVDAPTTPTEQVVVATYGLIRYRNVETTAVVWFSALSAPPVYGVTVTPSGFVGDPYLYTTEQSAIVLTAKTPVTATSTQACNAAFEWLTRIPADSGAAIVSGSLVGGQFAAGYGWAYDASTRAFYPSSGSGITGTAITPLVEGELSPLPGENTLVVHCNGGTVTINGIITPQRITRG